MCDLDCAPVQTNEYICFCVVQRKKKSHSRRTHKNSYGVYINRRHGPAFIFFVRHESTYLLCFAFIYSLSVRPV